MQAISVTKMYVSTTLLLHVHIDPREANNPVALRSVRSANVLGVVWRIVAAAAAAAVRRRLCVRVRVCVCVCARTHDRDI